MFCLVALALALPLAIEGMNSLISLLGGAPIDWRAMLATARAAPFTEGLMVTGMVLTTLLPTLIHLALGLGGLFSHFSKKRHEMAQRLSLWAVSEADGGLSERDKNAVITDLTKKERLILVPSIIGAFLLLALACFTLAAAVGAVIYFFTGTYTLNFGYWLAELALWSGGLVS